ncbi:uncharacterized protein LOC106170920 isoform X2 [Lingula anatina]|uniref:Uncharacterized protein LOC106170920 isoform X2 n=1 Tax=Lingula anatina TaxID=7574 RepID=A0A1S3J986_LINAN|nr:uncharacterized protein LOC106170920 isoform X2 [Lingula anatina]|eukprot:XP_013406434.1 uncharacterized protein LOC106170920 isoform X2 [Lingula anatina]
MSTVRCTLPMQAGICDSGEKEEDEDKSSGQMDSGLETDVVRSGSSEDVEPDAAPFSPTSAFAPTIPIKLPAKFSQSLLSTKESPSDDKEDDTSGIQPSDDVNSLDSGIHSLSVSDIDEKDLPLKLRIPQYDALLLYDERDKTDALELRDILETDDKLLLKDKSHIKICTTDDEVFCEIQSDLQQIDTAVECSTFILMYMSEHFVGDKWLDLQRDEIIMTCISEEEKKWCVIPLWTVPKRKAPFKIPFGLRSLRGIDIGSIDQYFYRSVKNVFDAKLSQKEKRRKALEDEKQTVIEKLKQKKQLAQKRLEFEREEEQKQLESEKKLFFAKQQKEAQDAEHHRKFEILYQQLQTSKQTQNHLLQEEILRQDKERQQKRYQISMEKIQHGEITMKNPSQQPIPPEMMAYQMQGQPFLQQYPVNQGHAGSHNMNFYGHPPVPQYSWPYPAPPGHPYFGVPEPFPYHGSHGQPYMGQSQPVLNPGLQGYGMPSQQPGYSQYSGRPQMLESQLSTVSMCPPPQSNEQQCERQEIQNSSPAAQSSTPVSATKTPDNQTGGGGVQMGHGDDHPVVTASHQTSVSQHNNMAAATSQGDIMGTERHDGSDVVADCSLTPVTSTGVLSTTATAGSLTSVVPPPLSITRTNREPTEQEDDSMVESSETGNGGDEKLEDSTELPIHKISSPSKEYRPLARNRRQGESAQFVKSKKKMGLDDGEREICGVVTGGPQTEVMGGESANAGHRGASPVARMKKRDPGADHEATGSHRKGENSSSYEESDGKSGPHSHRSSRVVKEVHHHYYGARPETTSKGSERPPVAPAPTPAAIPPQPPTQIINIYNSSGIQIGNHNTAVVGQSQDVVTDGPESPQDGQSSPIRPPEGPASPDSVNEWDTTLDRTSVQKPSSSTPCNSTVPGQVRTTSRGPNLPPLLPANGLLTDRNNQAQTRDQDRIFPGQDNVIAYHDQETGKAKTPHSSLLFQDNEESTSTHVSLSDSVVPSILPVATKTPVATAKPTVRIKPVAAVSPIRPQVTPGNSGDLSETDPKSVSHQDDTIPKQPIGSRGGSPDVQGNWDQTALKLPVGTNDTQMAVLKPFDSVDDTSVKQVGGDSEENAVRSTASPPVHNEMLAGIPSHLRNVNESEPASGVNLSHNSYNMDNLYPSNTEGVDSITQLKRQAQQEDLELNVGRGYNGDESDEFVNLGTEAVAMSHKNITHLENPAASHHSTGPSSEQSSEQYISRNPSEVRSEESGLGASLDASAKRIKPAFVKPKLAVVPPANVIDPQKHVVELALENPQEQSCEASQVMSPGSSGLGRSVLGESGSPGPEHPVQSQLPPSKLAEGMPSFSTEPVHQNVPVMNPVQNSQRNDTLEKDTLDSEDGSESSGRDANAKKKCIIQ